MKNLRMIIYILVPMVVGIMIGAYNSDAVSGILGGGRTQPSSASKFDWTLNLLDKYYVDVVNRDSLLEKVVPSLISELDPHSQFIPAEDLVAVNEGIEGKFDGIGVVFNMATDTAIVMSVITGGPGFKAGVEPGDRIIMVNDTVIAGMKIDQMDIVSKLRGKRGTEVKLSIQRGKNDKLVDFTLTRDVIPITSIDGHFMTRDSAAYVKIKTFAQNTYYETLNAIDELVKGGATSVVIDLRGNGGGLLDQALRLANEFLSVGQGIVYIQGEHFERREQLADGRGAFQTIPLYVVIDESSASASEIFAGAIQDNDRGTIIGRRSFGKGLVQEQIPYSDGSAVRLTVARYYTPLGRPLQKPYTAGDEAGYEAELIERFKNNEVKTGINAHVDSSKVYTTPQGRTLFGGGGITPDVFVPVDTTELPKYFIELFQNNAIFPYGQKMADKYRKTINSIDEVRELDSFFDGMPNLYDDFIAYAKSAHGVAVPSAKDKEESEEIVMAQLRAYIGRYTPLQESAFYYYTQQIDNAMQKVFSIIDSE